MNTSSSGKERVDVSSKNDEDCFPQRESLHIEQAWYTSPEEHAIGTSSFASDIYSLGVLMSELFCSFVSEVDRARAMADLRNRFLQPRLLSKPPKEASFCLWLLHPDPLCKPKAREVYHCELLVEAGDAIAERQAAVQLEEKETESEVLYEFLLRMQSQKQDFHRENISDSHLIACHLVTLSHSRTSNSFEVVKIWPVG